MVVIPDNIKLTLNEYLAALNSNSISLRNAYLFGSYAKGTYDEWSDIDIAIVSDQFEGIRIKDRDKIRRITLGVSSRLEVLPFRTSDFSIDDPLAREIIETGIKLL